MYRPDAVFGLVSKADTDDTLRDLEAHGVHRSEIEVRDPTPGRYTLADEYLHDDAHGAFRGGARGAGIGLLVGLATVVAASSAAAFGPIAWFVMAFGGLGFGGLIGAMWGLQRSEHADDDPVRWQDLDDPTGWTVVEVHCQHWRNRAHEILMRHGAQILEDPVPVGR